MIGDGLYGEWIRHKWWWHRLRTGEIVPVIRGAMNDPTLDQLHFRRVADDGDTNAGTLLETEDGNWTQPVDVNFRIRFTMEETNGENANGGSWQLQYNLASSSWNNVDATSSVVRSAAGAGTESGATTNRLTAGSGSFVAGNYDEVDGVDSSNLTASNFTEYEYCCQIRSADVVDAQTLQLRVTWSGTQNTPTFSVTPTLTVDDVDTTVQASVSVSASVTAALSTQIQMVAAVSASASVTAALTTQITMAASLAGSATVSQATLTTAIELATALTASGTVAASLTTAIQMQAALAASATVSATLTTQITMQASLAGSGTVTADLTTGAAVFHRNQIIMNPRQAVQQASTW